MISRIHGNPRARCVPCRGRLREAHHGSAEGVEEARPERDAARNMYLAGESNAGDASVEWQGVLILLYTVHGDLHA
jgi:hypothetical protein